MDTDGDTLMRGVYREEVPTEYVGTGATVESRAFLDQMEEHHKGKMIAVPTDDEQVRQKLRQLEEPVTYFGEDKADRRDRLRKLLLQKQEGGMEVDSFLETQGQQQEEQEEEFWSQGEPELKHARKFIKKYSLEQAQTRKNQQQWEAKQPLQLHVKNRRQVFERIVQFDALGTQSGLKRPVSSTKTSPDGKYIAAADWAGCVKLFSLPNLDEERTYQGHTGKVGGLAWNPTATAENTFNFSTGGLAGDVKLWSLDRDMPLATCPRPDQRGEDFGHESQVTRVDVHPSGRYIASASQDMTWRLWDVETQQELLVQEGHAMGLTSVKFQCDGSLAASAGSDAVGRVWDLRTGNPIMTLNKHIKAITSLDWSPNGFQIATGSADNSVIVWDLRQQRSLKTIPAHLNLVSDVCFYKGTRRRFEGLNEAGTFLATGSHDGKIKFWSADNWVLKHTMEDSTKVMCLDISPDQEHLISGRWDRCIKLWGAG